MQTIHRTFDILEYLAKQSEPVLLNDIAKELNLSTTSAHNFLKTLEERGYVKHAGPRKGFTLGSKFRHLADSFNELPPDLSELAKPYLKELGVLTDESVYLGIFKNNIVVTIAYVLSTKLLAMGEKDKFIDLHASSQGKVYLSTLSESDLNNWLDNKAIQKSPNTITEKKEFLKEIELIRNRGYALNAEEMEVGLCSVAAPVHNELGKIIGTIAIGFPSVRASEEAWVNYPQYAVKTAEQISGLLGWKRTNK